jgi:hypothetical protein
MNKIGITIFVSLMSLILMAHEGHNKTPGSFKSLHGGTVQNGKELNLEVIINAKELTVFPTSHESKDVPEKDIKISATAKPKKGKAYPVSLVNIKGGYSATIDLQGSNRLPVEITVISHGKTDHFTVQVEE